MQMHVNLHLINASRGENGGMTDTDRQLLEGAPRLFGIVADIEDDGHPCVVAWGHELAEHAVTTWMTTDGSSEVQVFPSAEAALDVAEQLYPARLIWMSSGV
jgi:hypothetical protein